MIRQNRKIQFIILLTLICLVGTLSIAYAVLSTTLNITGTAQVMEASWNIHFSNIQVNPASVPITPKITDNNKITFSADLNEPGDFYKFTVDIVNDGTIDAMIDTIIKTPELTTEQKKYLRYEVEYIDGQAISTKQMLKSKETKTITILFSYRTDIPVSDLPTTSSHFDLEITMVYYQADTTATTITTGTKKINTVSGDLNTVGSEFCIGEECFYLIKNDGYNAILLAKYNLYISGYYDSTVSVWNEYGSLATGKQEATMLGYVSKQTVRNGVTSYSNESQKGENYSDYSGSIAEIFVNNYKDILQKENIEIASARLITKQELNDLGCDDNTKSCASAPKFVYQTSYWTSTPANTEQVWRVSSTKEFDNDQDIKCTNNKFMGIRPVIEVPLTEF